MEMGWGTPLAEDSWLGLLAWFPTQKGFRMESDCLSSLSGLGTIFCSRWDYELASLLCQGSRPGHRDCIAHCFLVQIQAECALNPLLRPPALLCSWGKPWTVLCSSGTALQISWWTRPMALLCKLSTLTALLSAPALYWTTQLQGVVVSISGQIGPGYCFTVTESCLTLGIPTDCRMAGFLVLHSSKVCSNSCPLRWWVGFNPRVGKIPWRRDGNPLQYSCLENPINRESWWATVHKVEKSQTRLKWLSMHKLVMLSNHLTLSCTFLLLPSIFLIIRVFSNELCVIFVYSSVNGQ